MIDIELKKCTVCEKKYYLIYKDFRNDIVFEKKLTVEDLNILHKKINEIFEGVKE